MNLSDAGNETQILRVEFVFDTLAIKVLDDPVANLLVSDGLLWIIFNAVPDVVERIRWLVEDDWDGLEVLFSVYRSEQVNLVDLRQEIQQLVAQLFVLFGWKDWLGELFA